MANNISLSEILHNRPAVVPTIYGYVLPDLKDHDGYIKIGYTDRKDTETRIREQVAYGGDKFQNSVQRIGNACRRNVFYGQRRSSFAYS